MTIAAEFPNTLYETTLVGGDEMAALMRARFADAEGNADWSSSPLSIEPSSSQSR